MLTYLLSFLCLTSCIKERQTGADLTVGDRIPDFTVTLNDGTAVTGAHLSEGLSCIVFFTTGCPDCRQTLPHLQTLYDEKASDNVRFALISREEREESIARFWSEQGLTMPYSAQENRTIYELFARTRVPRIYICRDGVIKAMFTDTPEPPSYNQLKEALERF